MYNQETGDPMGNPMEYIRDNLRFGKLSGGQQHLIYVLKYFARRSRWSDGTSPVDRDHLRNQFILILHQQLSIIHPAVVNHSPPEVVNHSPPVVDHLLILSSCELITPQLVNPHPAVVNIR